MSIKVKFKEERQSLEVDKKRLQKEVHDGHQLLEQASQRYQQLKQEVEESPLQTLRMELGAKQLEITSLQTKLKQAQDSTSDYMSKFELLKKDMVQLKRQIDQEKEIQLQKQAQELEELKQMMRIKQAQDEERAQYEQLKQQLG